jgi:hypothetical protein
MSLFAKPQTKGVGKSNYSKKTATAAAHSELYNQILINRTIPMSITNVGNNIKENLTKMVAQQIEGKCIVEGYIKPDTVEIITFSSGLVMGSQIIFEVVFQCYVCSPVEGMHINCIAKHINKAGIRAEVKDTPSPVVIFIARDHNYASPLFAQVKENDAIKIRVIGQRFELNDTYISIIAELVEDLEHIPSIAQLEASIKLAKQTLAQTEPTLAKQTLAKQTLAKQTLAKQTLAKQTLAQTEPLPTLVEEPIAPTEPLPTLVEEQMLAPTKKKTVVTIKKPKITINK